MALRKCRHRGHCDIWQEGGALLSLPAAQQPLLAGRDKGHEPNCRAAHPNHATYAAARKPDCAPFSLVHGQHICRGPYEGHSPTCD